MTTFIISIILASLVSAVISYLFAHHFLKSKAIANQCPFHNACTSYHDVETKQAIKRVLSLLIENNTPPSEIQSLVDSELK